MNRQLFSSLTGRLPAGASQIAGAYLILGSAWILLSDRIAARIVLNEEMLNTISLYKEWGYMLVTALLLYWLIRRHTAALQASELQLHQVIDELPAWISYVGSDRHYRFVNSAYADWFEGDILGKHIEQVIGASAYQSVSKHIDEVLAGKTVHYETEVALPKGERDISAVYVPDIGTDRKVRGFFALIHDVTEQKKGREELRLWADAFEGCAHGIAICDPNTNRIVICNPAFAKMHKSQVEDIAGSPLLSLYSPADHEQVRQGVQKADQIGHARFEASMGRRGTDGSTFPVQMDVVSVLGKEGEVLHRVLTAQDISERKHAEEELRKSEERYHYLFANNPHPMWIYDRKTLAFLEVNEAAIVKYGYSRDEFLNMTIIDIRPPEDVAKLVNNLAQPRNPLEHSEGWRHRLRDGTIIHVEISSHTVEVDGHESALVVAQDITDRKRAEKVLQESEERYRMVSELTSDYAYKDRVEQDGSIIPEWVTESFTRITGYTLEETSAPGFWQQLVHPEDIHALLEHTQNVLSGQPDTMEIRAITKNGGLRWLRDYANPIWNADQNRVVGLYGAVQDVTEHKQAQEKLLLQARWLEHINDAIITSDKNLVITSWNLAAERIYGWKAEEVIGKSGGNLFQTEFFSTTRADALQQLQATGEFSAEITHLRKDGSRVFIETHTVALHNGNGQITGYVSVNRDISERKLNEEALRLKDELLRLTSEMAKVGGWEFDPQTGKGTWTDEVARIHDLNPAAETSVKIGLNFYEGESREKIEQAVKEAIELAKPYDLELEMLTAKGNRKWVRTVGLPIARDGKVIKVQGIFQDITERKEIEKALQVAHDALEGKVEERTAALSEANALLQALMDNIPDQIYFKDTQSRFIRNSRSQAALLGLSDPSQAVGKTDFDFFPHATRSFAEEQEIMRSGNPLVDLEEWVVWPTGREMWVWTTKMPLRNSQGQTIGIFGISHDITERKRSEESIRQLNADLEKQTEQLRVANKELEAFSYSVSHDLRAPLRAIDGYTRILVEDYESILDNEGKRVCGVISREASRMGQLIDDLLAFSRLGRKEMYTSVIDMKALAVSVFEELLKENGARIDFVLADLPKTRGDSSLIRQVWINLLSNALKFTSKKERAVVEVGSQASRDETIYYVRDNGAGFEMEYGNKLFGVFQRLHSENEFSGTGVGLAIVQRIIHRHGGRVWAEGEVEKGATFYFALPHKENLS